VEGYDAPFPGARLGDLVVNEHDSRRCISGISEGAVVDLQNFRLHTERREVHQAWACNDPTVHGINDVTAIKLEKQPKSDTREPELDGENTKTPSASQLFKRNIMFGTTLIASE
jgi:hypothetical protein